MVLEEVTTKAEVELSVLLYISYTGAYPAPPVTYDDNNGQGGGGLYPSVPVKDEGGGGSWA